MEKGIISYVGGKSSQMEIHREKLINNKSPHLSSEEAGHSDLQGSVHILRFFFLFSVVQA